ncbi:MAG: DedA family protein [Fusicatenibacter sp.]|nr:DedA family protein [Lachnospiraceae bacterium]MDY2937292.1 DedA family protein [Fusicatenibacter sp.]
MKEMIVAIMNQYGYLGILFLIAVENIFPPIPSEVILTFGGFLTTYTELHVPGVVFASTCGSLIGALILYKIGTRLTPEKLAKLLETRTMHLLGFHSEDAWKTAAWFERHGQKAVLFGRCVPIIRSLVSIPSGMAATPMPVFLFYTILGSTVWNILLVSLGALLGASWENVVRVFETYSGAVRILLAGAVVLFFCMKIRKRRRKENL